MGIRYEEGTALLEGIVGVEDAEGLAAWLREQPAPAVALSDCEHVHGAVLQVLLALRPRVAARPAPGWLDGVLPC
ncbi:hypothetical protein [Azohydromonas aeria]|uniref:hypothetical protein n=1 Tax=Azohydromonas aeria TaxID=2590212 RepID=UPI0012FB01BA|nr:hypothetical protein [Azohydromonas aeria]